MKQVQDALRPTGIPAFAGAWKATSVHQTPPSEYLVYTTMVTENEHWDDSVRKYRVYVYLNLWTMIDPTATIRQVRAAMRQAGFAMADESDSYNDDTRQTLVAWTWVLDMEAEDESGNEGQR